MNHHSEHRIGHYTFLAGVGLAIFAGIISDVLPQEITAILLVIFGVVVGFMNIKAREVTEFLVAAITLIVIGTATDVVNVIPVLGAYLRAILENITIFVVPAALVVALNAIVMLADR